MRDLAISGTFEAGRDHYVRVSAEGFVPKATLRFVPGEEAMAEISAKGIEPNDDKKTYSGECVVPPAAAIVGAAEPGRGTIAVAALATAAARGAVAVGVPSASFRASANSSADW